MWGAAGCSQAVQVSHDYHGCLPKVNSQVVILRQGQVAQETLIWAQWGGEDLKITAVLISLIVKQDMTAVSRATHETTNTFDTFSPQVLLQGWAPPWCCVCSGSVGGGAAEGRWSPGWSARCPSPWCRFPTGGAAAGRQTAADCKDTATEIR